MAKRQSTNKPYTFSVVIIVKNDRGIAHSLERLMPQVNARTDTDVWVVDASAPETLADIKADFPTVNWLMFKNTTGKKITIPEQRNLGVSRAHGDVIIFLDANCLPGDNWLMVMTDGFIKEDHAAVTGLIKSVGGDSLHDAGYEIFADNAPIPECGAANFAVRRDVLLGLGGFNENLSYGEDIDLSWRLQDAGHQVIFKKASVIWHDWGTFAEERRRSFRYGIARASLYKHHPRRLGNLLGYDMNVLIYPLFLLLLPLTIWWPWYPLLILVPLLKNIRHHALKVTVLHLLYGAGVLKGIIRSRI